MRRSRDLVCQLSAGFERAPTGGVQIHHEGLRRQLADRTYEVNEPADALDYDAPFALRRTLCRPELGS